MRVSQWERSAAHIRLAVSRPARRTPDNPGLAAVGKRRPVVGLAPYQQAVRGELQGIAVDEVETFARDAIAHDVGAATVQTADATNTNARNMPNAGVRAAFTKLNVA
jgi:hypothetical protein